MQALSLPGTVEHHHATINGIRMHYVSAGTGDTILFLHGFPEFWYSWRHQLFEFSKHHRVVAPDLRGCNETENVGPYDTDTLQQDVLALIEHLGGAPVHLVGHDWGGAIAWLVAINHPEQVRTLSICNMPHPVVFRDHLRRPRQLLRSWYLGFFQVPWLPERALALRNYQILARTLIRDCAPGTFTRDDVKMYLEAWRRQGLNGGLNWYRALLRSRPQLAQPVPILTVPTLLAWGDQDIALGKELADAAGPYVRDLQVEHLPDAGHWVQQEAPARINALLSAHIQRHHGTDDA